VFFMVNLLFSFVYRVFTADMKVSVIGGISPPTSPVPRRTGLGDLRWVSNRELRQLLCIGIRTDQRFGIFCGEWNAAATHSGAAVPEPGIEVE
jgi:hypothetical protein